MGVQSSQSSDIEREHSVVINVSVAPKVNYASLHNAVPILRELVVENLSEQTLEALTVVLRTEPPVVEEKRWLIDQLGPGERAYIDDGDVVLDAGFMWDLTEALTARLDVIVVNGERELASMSTSLEILARNEWGGITSMPELIAAFVTPNDPAVEKVLKAASSILQEQGLSPALEGYLSRNPRRVAEIVTAIWDAIGALGISYSAPSASFERQGQKVRTPSHVVGSGLGTCLDLTLLFAASLEQAGLHPVIIFLRGHTLVGCWLEENVFADVVVDDPAALRNRIRLGELIAMESTLATHRPVPSFAVAVEAANRRLDPHQDPQFECVVDIHRARMQRIRPIPYERPESSNATTVVGWSDDTRRQHGDMRPLQLPDIPSKPALRSEELLERGVHSRLERWQRKLLDLSLRNRLLNFHPGKSSVSIYCPDPARLEDLLAEGAKLTIRSLPPLVGQDSGRSAELYRQRHHEDVKGEYAREGLERKEVYADLTAEELEARLVELYRKARTGLEEGGANILYLAIGFLTWRRGERAKEERPYRAPLLLVPVRLERSSVRAPMKLVRHDDEPQVNPTLLQMLEQDFKLVLPELQGKPLEDESGLDVRGIWNVVRERIKDLRGWEVTEEVVLSTFSFAKYLMWKDLVAWRDSLKHSPVVRHLLETPRDPYPVKGTIPNVSALDAEFQPNQTFTLLPADSSQLAAIMAVANGMDLIIEGPPGTGKSQTIANIITQCLAHGRTVLFVSEKRAALDVVYRRLYDMGLGDFCLELHSNKARKADVLEQLRRAWEARAEMNADEWAREATRLGRLRNSLNRFVQDLHAVYANGLTPYIAMGEVVRGKDQPRIPLRWSSPESHDKDQLDRLRELVDRIQALAIELESVSEHPLRAIGRGRWSPQWQTDFLDAVHSAHQSLTAVAETLETFLRTLAWPKFGRDRRTITAFLEFAEVLTRAGDRSYAFAFSEDAHVVISTLKEAAAILEERRIEAAGLSCRYSERALAALEVGQLLRIWQQSTTSWWPKRWALRRKVLRALRQAVEERVRPDPANDLPRLARIKGLDEKLARTEDILRRSGVAWRGVETDVTWLREVSRDAERLRAALTVLFPRPEDLSEAQRQLRTFIEHTRDIPTSATALRETSKALTVAWQRLDENLRRISDLAETDMKFLDEDGGSWLGSLEKTLNLWVQHAGKLRLWCAWREMREEGCAQGLQPLVEALESGLILPEDVRRAFEVNYCRWWANAVVEQTESLRTFVAAEHERRIDEFRRLDDRFAQLTRDYIRAKICSGIPAPGEVGTGSEWGTLHRELAKKRRHKPIRQLISEIPSVLTKLTPCLLMSPLSIAQYLPPGRMMFDVVIFDEASQIPVWDAIGAIARGRQAVIVGDPKQLPPTTFFERSEQDDEYAEDVEEDLESILDECRAARLPEVSLKWHYRSRHESLIAFSNHMYYKDTLVTFPSPVTEDAAVRLHFVPDGLYELGGARVNRPEAAALVAEVVRRMRDPLTRQQGLTIGIVTFNSEQQRLIEDLLDNERRADPSLEPWFAEDAHEPLMVKNLENVQGDERDIIYFSVTYGPDQMGRISMNFGPLNRDGGERRLNVAITRARCEMHIFSSLRAEHIDLSRTQSEGVRHLKRFLEYAEHGIRAFAALAPSSVGGFDSPFEAAVASALRHKGWEVHTQVGVSSYRIDLGVVHPDAPGRYLAGIECDGATYHRSPTARDRDKLREAVLRKLGWEIIRVWSTDWWSDPDTSLEQLDRRLRDLLDQSRQEQAKRRAAEPERSELRAEIEESSPRDRNEIEETGDVTTRNVTDPEAQTKAPFQGGSDQRGLFLRSGPDATHSKSGGAKWTRAEKSADEPSNYRVVVYHEADLRHVAVDPQRFFDRSYVATLRQLVEAVVSEEGPVRDEVLVRRIARVHGFQRAGSRIRERILSVAMRHAVKTKEDVGVFFWPSKEALASWRVFRRPPEGETRMVEDIPMEELQVLRALVADSGLRGEDALREMAAWCGISRLGSNVRARLERVLRVS